LANIKQGFDLAVKCNNNNHTTGALCRHLS